MRPFKHATLEDVCNLDVSLVSQWPQNYRPEDSQSDPEEISNSQPIKTAGPFDRINCFHSLLQQKAEWREQGENVKCSMLTDGRVEYFDAIEAVLLVQNQNLKNHNGFLLEQVKKMYEREKRFKRQAAAQHATIASLRQRNQELQITVHMLANELKSEIDSLQLLLMPQNQLETSIHNLCNTFNECKSAETNSQTVSQSLRTIKQIFGKDEEEEIEEEWNQVRGMTLNPERCGLDSLQSINLKKALGYTQSMKRKLSKNMSNHPIIRDIQQKLIHLNNQFVFTAKHPKKSPKSINLHKFRTFAC